MSTCIGGPSSGGGDHSGSGDGIIRNVVRRFGPPPAFLTKTFHMVNDLNSNSIICWGKLGDSFIIWDHIKFSAEILPNYFRHNNFSSFVYQLNNYDFRKIGVEHQWEYTSPYFQEGKPHLLPNMKRRPLPTPQKPTLSTKTLSKYTDESRHEIKKLKKQQSDTELHISNLRQKASSLESMSKNLAVQWAKACEIIAKGERAKAEAGVADIPQQEKHENEELECAEMIGDYAVVLDDEKERVFEDDGDEVCENGLLLLKILKNGSWGILVLIGDQNFVKAGGEELRREDMLSII